MSSFIICSIESCLFNGNKICFNAADELTPNSYKCYEYIDYHNCITGNYHNCRSKKRCGKCVYEKERRVN